MGVRLRRHAESVAYAENNLKLQDFTCRCKVPDETFIRPGEAFLIDDFRPVWNRVVTWFGNKVVGSGRANQERSRWDTVRPGRPSVGGNRTPSSRRGFSRRWTSSSPVAKWRSPGWEVEEPD
jgi:hypothetical protein